MKAQNSQQSQGLKFPNRYIENGGVYNRERIGYIDALKGFAILCVVVGHIADGYLDANFIPEAKFILYCIHNIVYAFHMPLFMMISGFVYCLAYFDETGIPNKSRIYHQVMNLIAIYFIFSISFGLLKVFCSRYVNKGVTLTDVLMVWAKPISPYWYLYALIGLYLIFSIKKIYWTDERMCYIVAFFAALIGPYIHFEYFELTHIMYYSFFFYTGMLYRRRGSYIRKRRVMVYFMISTILLALFWEKAYKSGTSVGSLPIVNLFVATGIILMIWFIFENISFLQNNSILKLCGRYSLEIYVIHCLFTASFRTIFLKIGITNIYLCIILNFIISTAIPVLFSMACKKINIHGLFFKPFTYMKDRNVRKRDNCIR